MNSTYSNYSEYQISAKSDNFDFLSKFTQKGYPWSKTEKVNIIIEFCIFKLVRQPNFSLNRVCWFFWPNFSKKGYFQSKTEKVKHDYWIFNIWLCKGTKFQLQLRILIFWTKLVLKCYFQLKTVKENNTIKFCIFDFV